jgi:hypothetical protein
MTNAWQALLIVAVCSVLRLLPLLRCGLLIGGLGPREKLGLAKAHPNVAWAVFVAWPHTQKPPRFPRRPVPLRCVCGLKRHKCVASVSGQRSPILTLIRN